MSEESVSVCLTCGDEVTYKMNTKECRSCRSEKHGYLPTEEEIEEHCKVFRQDHLDKVAAKHDHSIKVPESSIREYRVTLTKNGCSFTDKNDTTINETVNFESTNL